MVDDRALVQSSSRMVHVEGCPYVAHYVDGRRPQMHGEIMLSPDVRRLNATTEIVEMVVDDLRQMSWVPARVTPESIAASGAYSRCSHCAPDIPDYTSPTRYVSKEASSLAFRDVGRDSVMGRIRSISHDADGVRIGFDDGTSELVAPDQRVQFPIASRGEHRPASATSA